MWLNDPPMDSVELSHPPWVEVEVWLTGSLLVQVTVSPTRTVSVGSEKSLMVAEWVVGVAVGVG